MSPLRFGPKKTSRIPEKLVCSCQTGARFRRKQAPDAHAALDSRFLPRKAGKFHPAELCTACHRYATALFWAEKVRKNGQLPDLPKTLFFTRFSVFRLSTAACRGPMVGLVESTLAWELGWEKRLRTH